jgi:hypothetical protein
VISTARRTLAAALVAGAVALGGLTGFIRIAFGPTSPEFLWRQTSVSFVVNSAGSKDISDSSAKTAVRLAFSRWNTALDGSLSLYEDTTADATRTDYTATDIHLVLWDEDGSSGLFPTGSAIIALTPIIAQTGDGTIVDADIVFNGRDRTFTTKGDPGAFDVESVCTHECGHFVGLDHSGGPRVTMFQSIEPDATHERGIGRDEDSFLAVAYRLDTTRGQISGVVTAPGGTGLAFGYVVAVDAQTGEMGGGTFTDATGNYKIVGLLPSSYNVYVEPLDGPVTPANTTRLNGVTADTNFVTTYYPKDPVGVATGAETSGISFAVATGVGLNVTDWNGGSLPADGSTQLVTCSGTGMASITAANVPGPGVKVTGLIPSTLGGTTSVTVQLVTDPSAPRGIRPLELRDASGNLVVLTAGVQVLDVAPTIGDVTPITLRTAGGDNLTIQGSGFTSPVFVVIGGLPATNVQVIGTTEVIATAPANATAGPADVVVINPDGQEARVTGGVTYSATGGGASVDPSIGPLTGGTIERILGSGFVSPVAVSVGGQTATGVVLVSSSEIDFVLPPGEAAGPVDVVVSSGSTQTTIASGLTYVKGTAPQLTSFTPSSGPVAGGTSVTLTGTAFPGGAVVRFGGIDATVASLSSTSIVATTPAHAAGTVDVRVVDPSTGLTGLADASFTYQSATSSFVGSSHHGGGCVLEGGAQDPRSLLPLLLVLVLLVRRAAATRS